MSGDNAENEGVDRGRTVQLFIQCAATGTRAFLMERGIAAATTVEGAGTAEIAPERKDDIGGEQRVAYIIYGGDAEHDIGHGAGCAQTQEVEHGLAERQLAEHFVDDGDEHDEDGPD